MENPTKTLSLIVKILIPVESMTKDEQSSRPSPMTEYLYFYGEYSKLEERMEKAWRPGCDAYFYDVDLTFSKHTVSGKEKGEWNLVT